MAKSADAFRTISEVAEWLGSPAHVLRFWESKFSQVKPVKRAGGRRYYRPADMRLLGGIKKLLHDEGMTIKGVQKMLREQGVKHVASLSQPLEPETDDVLDSVAVEADVTAAPEPESGTVVPFQKHEAEEDRQPEPPAPEEIAAEAEDEPDGPVETHAAEPHEATPEEGEPASETAELESDSTSGAKGKEIAAAPEDEAVPGPEPELPAFLHRAASDAATVTEGTETPAAPEPEPEPQRPALIELPPDPQDDEVTAPPGVLSALAAHMGKPVRAEIFGELDALRSKVASLHSRDAARPENGPG